MADGAGAPTPAWGERGRLVLRLFAVLALLYLAAPLLALLLAQPWPSVPAALLDGQALGALRTSVLSASLSTLLVALGGVPLAYLLARRRSLVSWLATLVITVPLVFPAVVSGIAQLLLYGPYGPVGALFTQAGVPLDTSFAGVVLAQTFVAAPFLVIAARLAFELVPPATEEVARTLGASEWRVFWTISLPQAAAGVAAGLLLTWLRAMGEFGATAVLAYHPYTLPVYTYVQLTGLGVAAALPLALLALLASAVVGAAALLVSTRAGGKGAPV